MKNKYQKAVLMVNDSILVIIVVIINAVKHVVITLFPNHIICIIWSKWGKHIKLFGKLILTTVLLSSLGPNFPMSVLLTCFHFIFNNQIIGCKPKRP